MAADGCLLKKNLLICISCGGNPEQVLLNGKEMFSFEKMKTLICKDPFTIMQDISQKEYVVVIHKNDSHLYLLNGFLVEHPIKFSYVDGDISNKTYDLKMLLEALLKRKDIVFIDPDYCSFKNNESIQKIPSYNCDENRTETIYFLWRPSKSTFKKFYGNDSQIYPSWVQRRKIKELDLLGIEKFSKDRKNVK